ncbi:type II secretion system protein [Chitinilyticum piscinae]|uniref:Prepilin-type N-terminal cleavage/methylation domain-containing protein n=1 Tax=Chitinilyticum piscinae TaxID=2866724 RepID=A0A8J7KC93_9NEIS|nr:prepilin-type N-terminal cleavage/methylation domain-containing protein [Chitinilyticum piscinae]MBE9607749.1 prepilin-type N-terminal cleavage/methylation domain-containing protein [Chitinilyticum piscinae]
MKEVQRGFSLVELSVVLLIIGLLLGAMLAPLSAQLDSRRLAETRSGLAQAQEALLGYLLINNRLPCPSVATLAETAAGAGVEDSSRDASGQCALKEGGLPWVTLGVPQLDAWGRRLNYRVTAAFTKRDTGAQCGDKAYSKPCFTLPTAGDIDLKGLSGAALVSNVPAVVISVGANGLGAYLPDGSRYSSTSNADEQENGDGDTVFVSRNADENFDDQVVWLPTTTIMSKLVTTGKLP